MSESLFIEPADVLYLRGNKLFGDAGDYSSALMPPWPSLAAGAIRSRMLVDAKVDLHQFAQGNAELPQHIAKCLGTPEDPGTFRINSFSLGKQVGKKAELYFPLPADLVIFEEEHKTQHKKEAQQEKLQEQEEASYSSHTMRPQALDARIKTSSLLPLMPLLKIATLQKPKRNIWLNHNGLATYIQGKKISKEMCIEQSELWKPDPRLGIALDAQTRTAAEGCIYTSDAVALTKGVGFVVGISGANGRIPHNKNLRFGGDGRAAQAYEIKLKWPQADWNRIQKEKSFRLVLTTPGIFEDGWKLPQVDAQNSFRFGDSSAQLISACVSRPEVVSGWDIAKHAPKVAQRIAPVGSVYFFKNFEGSLEDLKQVQEQGLVCSDRTRRAEGFNNCLIANWTEA